MIGRRTLLLMIMSFVLNGPATEATSIRADLEDVRFEQKLGSVLPLDTILTDENGNHRQISNYFGKTSVILVFTYFRCPNLCTLVLNGLVQALEKLPNRLGDKLGQDYQILSVSINPLEKPPLALAKKYSYLARLGKTGAVPWHFLTGKQAQIKRLTDSAGFHYQLDKNSGEYSHPSGIIVVAPDGRISKYLFGIQYDSQTLHQAIQVANARKTGSWAEEILLYCFHYDPRQSTNGILIMRIVRITGAVGALSLIALLLTLFLWRRDKV